MNNLEFTPTPSPLEKDDFNIIEASAAYPTMRPQIAEIIVELNASEDNYRQALADLDSEDKGVRDEAIDYLMHQEEYLMNAADTMVRMGFDTPEEQDVDGSVRARLGIILEKLESAQ